MNPMASRVCVIDVPGLNRDQLAQVPAESAMGKWLGRQQVSGLTPTWPAVTCSVQATLTTGVPPARHGIVANGIPTFKSQEDQALVNADNFASYRREISFWEQSNQFLQSPRFWQDESGQSRFKTALLFFQHSMPGFAGILKPAADIVLTPKPDHGSDGKLTSLCWSEPKEMVQRLFAELGPFPLMNYWGPMAGIASSQWIAKAAAWVWREYLPQLQWVYIPHLDYDLQRFGPQSPQAAKAVEEMAGAVEPLFDAVLNDEGRIILLSEYAIRGVSSAISPNRILAEAGMLVTRSSPDGNLIDYQNSAAFAMADHQIAHVYTQDEAATADAMELLRKTPGLSVFNRKDVNLKHRRAGKLLLMSDENAWFDYRWWKSPSDAPAFAMTVDIHRKPGYDPLELFWDPSINGTSQDLSRIRGSHGRVQTGEAMIASAADIIPQRTIVATEIAEIMLKLLA